MTYTAPLFSNANREGVDVQSSNSVFTLSTSTPEYPGAPFSLGTQTPVSTDGTAVYCTAAGAITADDACLITPLFAASSLTAAIAATSFGGIVGVALQTMTTGQYGWFQTQGAQMLVNTVATATAHAQLYASGTAGRLTSVLATGVTVSINGITVVTTTTAAQVIATAQSPVGITIATAN